MAPLEELILSSWLHDILRFRIRARGEKQPQKNEKTLFEIVKQAAKEPYKDIIEEACFLANGREPGQEQGNTETPLLSIFSKISLGGERVNNDGRGYYTLNRISETCDYPMADKPKIDRKLYDGFWQDFLEDFNSFTSTLNGENVALLLEKYTSFIPFDLTETAYESRPDSPEPCPDTSLFDHLKATTAIASCIFQYDSEYHQKIDIGDINKDRRKLRYLWVGGDFSGVQKFIYTISAKGALKTLRARSFFLELLTEHVIYEILTELGLSKANQLFSGGSQFSLLLPNTSRAIEVLSKVKGKINNYLREYHNARLYLVLEHVSLCGNMFITPVDKALKKLKESICDLRPCCEHQHICQHKNISYRREELAKQIGQSKNKKYAELLKDDRDSFLELLAPKGTEPLLKELIIQPFEGAKKKCVRCGETNVKLAKLFLREMELMGCEKCLLKKNNLKNSEKRLTGECQICHQDSVVVRLPTHDEEEVKACIFCNQLFHLGEHLLYTKYIFRRTDILDDEKAAIKNYLKLGDVYYHFSNKLDKKAFKEAGAVWLVNEWKVSRYNYEKKVYPFLVANYPSWDTDVPKEFKELAKQATGDMKLGALKMDIDRLGDIFQNGFDDKEISLTRISSLSRWLTLFFKYYFNDLVRCEHLSSSTLQIKGKEKEKRDIVTVYSGGDDLFVVGAWDDIVEFAYDFRNAFKKFTCFNPDINISGGFVVLDHQFPLYQMARLAEKAKNVAKRNIDGNGKKDSFAPFYPSIVFVENSNEQAAMKWDARSIRNPDELDAQKVLNLVKDFLQTLEGQVQRDCLEIKAPKAFQHNLLSLSEMKRSDSQSRLYLPKLAYTLSRKGFEEIDQDKWNELKIKLLNANTINYLHPVLVWLELLTRKIERRG